MNRESIETIINRKQHSTKLGIAYDWLMIVTIFISLLPLMLMEQLQLFTLTEIVTTSIFVVDYLLRWITADLRIQKGKWSFILYPFTVMAIIDLLSILPGISLINPSWKIFRCVRLFRFMRVLKLFGISSRVRLLGKILYKERQILVSVLVIALVYIFVTALILFNVEPHVNPYTNTQTFHSFFDAIYWATVTLTTVGYGDICPVTDVGRLVGMLSSLVGVAIIALPSGVITASYLDELRSQKNSKQ